MGRCVCVGKLPLSNFSARWLCLLYEFFCSVCGLSQQQKGIRPLYISLSNFVLVFRVAAWAFGVWSDCLIDDVHRNSLCVGSSRSPPGVGRNMAEAAVRCGARVRFVTAVGDDSQGAACRLACQQLGMVCILFVVLSNDNLLFHYYCIYRKIPHEKN